MATETSFVPSKLEILSARVKKNPGSRLFLQLAEEYGREGHHDTAVKTCLQGLKRHPGFMPARVSLSKFYMAKGQYPEAREHLDKVLKDSPGNLKALKLQAETLQKLGSPEMALERLKEHIPYNPDDPELKRMVDELEEMLKVPTIDGESELEELFDEGAEKGETEEADRIDEEVSEDEETVVVRPIKAVTEEEKEGLDKEDEITTVTLAELYERQGHFEKAIQIYEKLALSGQAAPAVAEKLEALRARVEKKDDESREVGEGAAFDRLTDEVDEVMEEETAGEELSSVEVGRYNELKQRLELWLNVLGQEKGT